MMVRPVRTGRRINPGVLIVKLVMPGSRGGCRGRSVRLLVSRTARPARGAEIVGDEDEGDLLLVPEADDEVEDERGVFAVEVAGGLVGEENQAPLARLRAMATRWRSPRAWPGNDEAVLEADELKEFDGSCARFGVSGLEHRDLDVFEAVKVGRRWNAWKMKPIVGAVIGQSAAGEEAPR